MFSKLTHRKQNLWEDLGKDSRLKLDSILKKIHVNLRNYIKLAQDRNRWNPREVGTEPFNSITYRGL